MKRIVATLLLILLLCAALPVQAEPPLTEVDLRAASWKTVAQNSDYYARKRSYWFRGQNLMSTGCGPCSVANSLIAAFNISDDDTAHQVMLETLYLVANKHQPRDNDMHPSHIKLLLTASPEEYPVLVGLRDGLGMISYTDKDLQLEDILPSVNEARATGKPAILIGQTRASEQWTEYVKMSRWFYDQGMEDVMLIAGFISAGTEALKSPFGIGRRGHYMTLVIHVGEFQRHGTVYLLDSMPRGISRQDKKEHKYKHMYPFVTLNNCTKLRNAYDVTRLQDTVVKFSLKEEVFANCCGDDEIAIRANYMSLLAVIGRGLLFVYIP